VKIGWDRAVAVIALLIVYVGASCAGLFLIKVASEWRSWTFVVGFLLYAFGAALWMVMLRLMPLSYIFPIAAGALVLGTQMTGAYFLNEKVTGIHLFGMTLILAGIALITWRGAST
jgi:drug/metabolite transporter (DMT)-like permease